jgi:hypothetical protein
MSEQAANAGPLSNRDSNRDSDRDSDPGSDRGPARAGTGVPGPGAAFLLLMALVALNGFTGSYAPPVLPDYARSASQITGMTLMTTLVPPYLMAAAWLAQRRSLALVDELRARLPDPAIADTAAGTLRGALSRTWRRGLLAGLVLALFNTQPLDALRGPLPVLELTISMGQIVLWCIIGMLLGVRISAANAFRRIAEVLPVSLLRPDRQRSLTRTGVVDVAIIAGALLLTPLQSLDAEFRWYNYHFGVLVALPAATFFLLWPLQPLHRRNRQERDARLAAVERQLDALPQEIPDSVEASARLETLLAHRERLRSVRTWPLSTGLLSRVLIYLVIPPLAWAGAALVERVVDALLG